jgi:putative tryptophan/tyrosine transport system substrate-binding protein
MLAVNDPVGVGAVKSLDRPGTNVTGTTMHAPELIGERLRILKTIVPGLDKVAVAYNGNNKNNMPQVELLRLKAQDLGVEVLSLVIRKPEDVDIALEGAATNGAKALLNASTHLSIRAASLLLRAQHATGHQPFTPTLNTYWPAA